MSNIEKPKYLGMKKVVMDVLKTNKKSLDDLKENGYMKVKSSGFMDLNIDYLGEECGLDKYAVAHNYIQQGDLMKDPDMMFYDMGDTWYAASFEQDGFPSVHQFSVECVNNHFQKNPALQKKHQSFSNQWARNLRMQGFTKSKNIEI